MHTEKGDKTAVTEASERQLSSVTGGGIRKMVSSPGIWKMTVLLTGVALLLLFAPAEAAPISGSWASTMTLTYAPNLKISLESVAAINGSFSGIAYRNTIVFNQNGLYSYTTGANWAWWVLNFDTGLGLLGSVPRMDYWMFKTSTMLAGVSLDSMLLLEYESVSKKYGLGWQFIMGRDFRNGISLEITNQFGLEENIAEALGWEFGSGYDIVPRSKPAGLCYSTTLIEITGLSFCNSNAEITSKFSGKNGFDYFGLNWDFQLDRWPLGLKVDLQFQLQTKSLRLRPYLRTKAGCVELYLRVLPWQLVPGSSEITGLGVEGLKFTSRKSSPFTFSVLEAFDGHLYRRRGAATDIELRAGDYVVSLNPLEQIYYVATPYQGVCTLEKRDVNSVIAVDFYFEKGTGYLFDLALVTPEASFHYGDLSFRVGLAVGPATDPIMRWAFSLAF